jgi:pyrroline-5-carboxylate reductase
MHTRLKSRTLSLVSQAKDPFEHILITRMHVPLAPGGCTIAGLLALEDGRVRSTIARAIQIATERASELGQPGTK